MKGEAGLRTGRAFQYAGSQHSFGSGETLLIGLEHQPNRSV